MSIEEIEKDEGRGGSNAKRNNVRFLFIYALSLFFTALVLIIVSTAGQRENAEDPRNNADSIEAGLADWEEIDALRDERDSLLIEIDGLNRSLAEKDHIISELTYQIDELKNNYGG